MIKVIIVTKTVAIQLPSILFLVKIILQMVFIANSAASPPPLLQIQASSTGIRKRSGAITMVARIAHIHIIPQTTFAISGHAGTVLTLFKLTRTQIQVRLTLMLHTM